MTARDAALLYAARGWGVLPCHEPGRGGGCSCGRAECTSPAKHPRTRRGLHDATTDPATIAGWWRRWPTANVAVRTGAVSGLVVVDIDPGHGGEATLTRLAAEHGSFPPTLAVTTGSGGRHLYFAHPGAPVRNSAGAFGPGVDIRSDGGYVIAPPSRHLTGGTYRWGDGRPLASLPAWLEHPPPQPAPARRAAGDPPRADASAWAHEALSGELARVRGSQSGRRNNDLNRAAFALGQLVGAGHLDRDAVHDLLVDAGLAVGLSRREVAGTVRSGLDAGSRHPRHPAERHAGRDPGATRDIDLRTIDLSPSRTGAAPGRHHDSAGRSLP